MRKDERYLEIRNRKIRKSNELIQKSRFSLSLQQQKIVLYLISQIQPQDEDFKLYEFEISEFCRVCGIEVESGRNYELLKDQIKKIADKSMWVYLEDGRETLVRWIEKPYIEEGTGKISIKLDKDMKPFLLKLKERYTTYELIWTLHFKSKYTIRLYELIKSIHFNELQTYKKVYPIEELKRLLDAETYKTYQALKERVLMPATEEINRYSEKNISFEPIRKGKKFVAVELTVSTKEAMEMLRIRSEVEKEMGTDQITLWELLEEKGFTE